MTEPPESEIPTPEIPTPIVKYEKKKSRIEMSKENENALIEKVVEMKNSKMQMPEIVDKLNTMGLTTPRGHRWNRSNLCYFLTSRRRKFSRRNVVVKRLRAGRKQRRPAVEHRPKEHVPRGVSRTVIESIITDPALDNNQRVGMLAAYLDV